MCSGSDPAQIFLIDPDTGGAIKVENGHLSVITHGHEDSGVAHFHIEGLTAATYRYILVDRSDTTNYPHDNDLELHVEWLQLEVDANNTAEYDLQFGFLENVDDTNGDRYVWEFVSGNKTAGNSIRIYKYYGPSGPIMASERLATGFISLNDTNYQTDVNLPSTLDPATSDTPSGNGDIILEAVVSAGEITLHVTIGYHSHAADH
jgi:hypothetical protein